MTLQIFLACISPSEPAREVKSWAKANTGRPFTRPKPVTTPSAGISTFSMPKLTQRCVDKNIGFPEGPGVKKEVQALPGGELAGLVLLLHRLGAAHGLDLLFPLLQLLKLLSHSFHRRLLFNISPCPRC